MSVSYQTIKHDATESVSSTNEYLYTLIVQDIDTDTQDTNTTDISRFTLAFEHNHTLLISNLLQQNGYIQSESDSVVDNTQVQELLERGYNTHEDGTLMRALLPTDRYMTRDLSRVKENKGFNWSRYPVYLRKLPDHIAGNVQNINDSILHFSNNTLRDRHGFIVHKPYHSKLQALSIDVPFDILDLEDVGSDSVDTDKGDKQEFIILDIAFESEYSQRRNIYYEMQIESHLDYYIESKEQLCETLSKLSETTNTSTNTTSVYLIRHQDNMYKFGGTQDNLFFLTINNNVQNEQENSEDKQENKHKTDAKWESEQETSHEVQQLRNILLTRGVLV